MKKYILSTLIVIFGIASSFSQGIEVVSSLSTSSSEFWPYKEFSGARGYGINLQFKPIDSLIQFGLAFHQYYNTIQYQTFNWPDMPPFNITSIDNFTTNVERTSYRFNALAILRNNKYVFCAIGVDVSINILSKNLEDNYLLPDSTGKFSFGKTGYYSWSIPKVRVWGFGFLSKIEIKNIFTPRLSLCFNIRPEFIKCSEDLLIPGPNYGFYGIIRFTEFQIGLKYNFPENIFRKRKT